jgi:hypothetical protein
MPLFFPRRCLSLCLALAVLAACRGFAAAPRAAAVVAIDSSGSMSPPQSPRPTPFEQALSAASLFVAGCDPTLAPGLITFDSQVEILTPRLEPATPERRRALLAALHKARAGGNTDILGAVAAALKLLEESAAPAKWVVLLSDGGQTQGVPADLLRDVPGGTPAEQSVRAAGKVLAARARSRGVRFLTVGLGPDVDRTLLETWPSTPTGPLSRSRTRRSCSPPTRIGCGWSVAITSSGTRKK